MVKKAVCRLVWDMNRAECDAYLENALSGIPEHFSGKLLEGAGGNRHSDHAALQDAAGGGYYLSGLLGRYDGAGTGKGGIFYTAL